MAQVDGHEGVVTHKNQVSRPLLDPNESPIGPRVLGFLREKVSHSSVSLVVVLTARVGAEEDRFLLAARVLLVSTAQDRFKSALGAALVHAKASNDRDARLAGYVPHKIGPCGPPALRQASRADSTLAIPLAWRDRW